MYVCMYVSPMFKPVLQQIMGGKTSNIAIQLFLQGCCKTVHLYVAVLPYLYDNLLVVINFFKTLCRSTSCKIQQIQ